MKSSKFTQLPFVLLSFQGLCVFPASLSQKHLYLQVDVQFACAGEGSEVKVVAVGPQAVQFVNAGYGRHTATLVTAGSYVLTATFGGKLASGVEGHHRWLCA